MALNRHRKMSDYLSRGFQAQISTVMDSVLRTAVFEITELFDKCIHDYSMQLAQKGEVIAQLEIKLQKMAQLLKEHMDGDRSPAMMEAQHDEIKGMTEDLISSSQSSTIPEDSFEGVSAESCAPPFHNSFKKEDQAICPSVKLHQLSIPLQHCPVTSQVENSNQNSNFGTTKGSSQSKSKKCPGETKRCILKPELKGPLLGANDMENVPQNIEEEKSDQPITGATRSQQHVLEDKTTKQKKERDESQMQVKDDETFVCNFCMQWMLTTALGLYNHMRTHRRCRACQKYFSLPRSLKIHERACPKLKKMLEAARATELSQPDCNEVKSGPVKQEQVTPQEESAPPSDHSVIAQKKILVKTFSCVHCNKQFSKAIKLKEHMMSHSNERRKLQCGTCLKEFYNKQALDSHIVSLHENQSKEMAQVLNWMEPIEDPEEDTELNNVK